MRGIGGGDPNRANSRLPRAAKTGTNRKDALFFISAMLFSQKSAPRQTPGNAHEQEGQP
jgi:hypothetical protein